MHQNVRLASNGVDRVRLWRKIWMRLRGTNFCTSSARFAPSFVRQPNGPNAPKWYEIHQNVSLGSNGVDRVRLLRKIWTRLRGTNFCTSSARFAPSFVRQPKVPKHTQIVQNAPKHQVRSLRKIPTRLRSTNFCTSSVRFPPSFVRQPKSPGRTQLVRNAPKRQFRP